MNRLKKALVPILSVLCIISIVVMVIVLCNEPKNDAGFVAPEFDVMAIEGIPEPSQELGWSEIYQDGMNFKVGICGNIVVNGDTADIYFANTAGNAVWLKLRVLDEQNNIICETGLIKPNEYIKSISFENEIQNGEKIKLKIMAYEPETYYSEGSIVLNTNIKIGG